MTKAQHKRTVVASMFQNGISRSTKCAEKDGFCRAGHIYRSGYPLASFLLRFLMSFLLLALVCGYAIPLLKSTDKDPSIPSNYRRISLISFVGKVFERFLLFYGLGYLILCFSPLYRLNF